MEAITGLISIIGLVLSILVLIKFFMICSDVEQLRKDNDEHLCRIEEQLQQLYEMLSRNLGKR